MSNNYNVPSFITNISKGSSISSSNYLINSLAVGKIATINDIQGSFSFPPSLNDPSIKTMKNGGPSYNYSNKKGSLITTSFNSTAGLGTKNSIAAGISNKIVINKPPPLNVLGKSLPIGVLKCTENNNILTCKVEKTFQINNDVNVTFAQFGDTYIPPA